MSVCAYCQDKNCQNGFTANAPKGCPTEATTVEAEMNLYSDADKTAAAAAAMVEAGGYGVLCRVEETMEYAIQCGYEHLGIAFCTGFSEEAKILANVFRANGFKVDTVCCKNGAVSKSNIGIDKDHFVDNEDDEIMCNPAGQARVLDEAGCQLNIILGLCVGHDTLFIKNSKAPVTVLATKDRVTGHNPLAPLYTSKSYWGKLFNYRERRAEVFRFANEDADR